MNKFMFSLLLLRTLSWCQDPVRPPPVSSPKSDPVLKVGSGVSAPTLLYKVEPQYTEEARQARIEGTVFLLVEVNPDGRAVNPRVLRSIGYGLDEKAVEAVAQWRFRPGAKDGAPVTVAATIEVNFRLLKNPEIAPPTTAAAAVDPQLHANVVKLLELGGDRERVERTLPQVLKDAADKMRQVLPGSDPAYFEEWARRMASRLNVQDLVDEEARVWERHFTSTEIAELLAVQEARKESRPAEVRPQLRQKIASETPAIQREIIAERQELFARVGDQIPDEIFKEHPEYKTRKPVAPSPAPRWNSPEEADKAYRTLVNRVKGGDFSVDFRVLRLACVKSNLCQPRSTPQELSEMQSAEKEHQLNRAIELAEHLIDRGFVNFEAHAECSGLYRALGDEPKAIFHLQIATALAGSILGMGDGETKETAFEVISDREEYVVLASLGLPYAGSDVLSNSRITDSDHHYDKWSVRKPKSHEVVDVFFNTDQFSQGKSRVQP